MRVRTLGIFVIAGLISATAACEFGDSQDFTLAFSEKERNESPDVPVENLSELAAGNNEFALNLYSQLATEDGNLFMSPYSVALALAMTYAGASGETAEEMAEVLGFTLAADQLHAAFNALDQLLETRGSELNEDEKFTLNVVNSLWGQDGLTFEQDFLDTVAENYGGGMRLVDFATETEKARLAINRWVKDNTNDRIEELLVKDPPVISRFTALVLVNAIFFKADWNDKFDPSATRDAEFHFLDGTAVSAQMMRQTEGHRVSQGEDYSAIELRYAGNETSMVVLLPDEGEFKRFESSLDAQKLSEIISDLRPATVDLTLPKFSFESKFSLIKQLTALGMEKAFDPALADFSGMIRTTDLSIGNVIHQAFVAVDEEGTEASAATAVITTYAGMPDDLRRLVVDRPFIFLIRDTESNTTLFMGRVLNPT